MKNLITYNNEPLQLSYSNDYTPPEKIEIVLQIQQDYESGMLSVDQMRWIVFNCRFGAFTVQRIIDKLMFDGKLKAIVEESIVELREVSINVNRTSIPIANNFDNLIIITPF